MSIAHYEHGDAEAPPLILSSSLGTTAEMWHPQLETLSSRYRVITYDHRGHGRSRVTSGPYSLDDLGSDVISVMDNLEIARADFAGLSLGGMVGMWLAANAPERIRRLALLCTFAKVASVELWHDRAHTVRESGTASMVEASLQRWFTAEFLESRPEIAEQFARMLASISAEGYAGCCEAIATMSLDQRLNRIEAQALVVAGTHDSGATTEIGRQIAAALPNGRYAEVHAAHLASVERPYDVNRLLIEHFG